jgi:hypothetical protein
MRRINRQVSGPSPHSSKEVIMLRKLLIVASLSVVAGHALASEATVFDDHFIAQKTRAEVKAEVLQARDHGTLDRSGEATREPVMAISTRTREAVRAEAMADAGRTNRLYVGG